MPIVPLSSAPARLIGAAAGITSPCAVVKELLDNAIDAGADAVEVAVSLDTLERLRVRDNGQGIAPSDMDHLGRPAHTSKLAAFDELAAGRVRTLGFRGQALASIVGVSASVHVVTRTAGEPVARRLRLGRGEGRQEEGTVSAPVGTTVEVEGLFASLPPRRRVLLKEARRTVARIREVLVAYALANPALRVGFRVLGDERQACTLGQTRGRDMKRSVLEVFGPAVAAAGQTHRFASATAASSSSSSSCTLLAFLPSIGGDHRVLAGKGAFISVNGRPLCSTTGIGKALAGVLKTKMQPQLQRPTGSVVQKPLFLLEILCPFTDYDANIATLKDDVLFADADALLRTFGEMCEQVYGKTSAALGGSGRGTMRRVQNGSASTKELPMSSSTGEKLVSTQMRTAYRVNMHRTNSNATDEEADFKVIEVTAPERRQIEIQMELNEKGNCFKGGVSKPMHGIERYFQRTAAADIEDFEIATDDTATPEQLRLEERHEENAGAPSNRTTAQERMPLSDVPDAALNTLAGIHCSMSSDGFNHGDGPRLSDLHGTSWNIHSLVNQQRVLGAPLTTTRGGDNSNSSSLAGSPASQTRAALLLQRARVPLLRTPPPSSDPTAMREEPQRSFVPASRVVAQPSPASSSDSSEGGAQVKGTPARSAQQPMMMRHAAALSGTRSFARYGVRRGGGVMAAPRAQGRPLPATTRPRQQATSTERVAPAQQLEYEQEEGQEDAEDAATTRQGNGTPWASTGRGVVGRAGGALQRSRTAESDTSAAESAAATPASRAKRRRGTSQEAGRSAVARRAAPRASPPRMQWSVNQQSDDPLPLERVPAGMGTWRCVTTAEASFSDARMWMDLEREMDAYIRNGTLALGWLGSGVTGPEAMRLEARVKRLCRV